MGTWRTQGEPTPTTRFLPRCLTCTYCGNHAEGTPPWRQCGRRNGPNRRQCAFQTAIQSKRQGGDIAEGGGESVCPGVCVCAHVCECFCCVVWRPSAAFVRGTWHSLFSPSSSHPLLLTLFFSPSFSHPSLPLPSLSPCPEQVEGQVEENQEPESHKDGDQANLRGAKALMWVNE